MPNSDEGIVIRLDTVIRLLAAPLVQGKSTAEAVRALDSLGIDANQIAVICGVAPNVIRARLSEIKKKSQPSKGRNPRPRANGG